MDKLTIDNFKTMLNRALENIKLREDEFSKLDAVTGDGDHGQAIVSAMSAAVEAMQNDEDFKVMLNDIGFNIMMKTSGSTSTLLGAFFLGMSDCVQGNELDTEGVAKMFAGGLANVRKQTNAMPGDKTMMDALYPAVRKMQDSTFADIKGQMIAAAEAAEKGAAATLDMKANFGRARNYGERSIGYIDSGASSWACMFSSFAEALQLYTN